MKAAPDGGPIWSAWGQGQFLAGRLRPCSRVTVEPGYQLNTANRAGPYTKLPVRWWQKADNSQVEVEIPGIKSVEIDYNLDQDAATATIQVYNTRLNAPFSGDPTSSDLGQPGYLTSDRGSAANRWNFTPNEWAGILGCNALVRCVDTDTEALTRRGWLRWDAIGVGDELLGINPATGRSEWQGVEEVFRREYEGPLTRMLGRVHDSLTTGNHRWLTKTRAGRWSWRTTETLTTDSSIPISASVELPTVPTYSDDLVELCAWYFTEGSHEHRRRSLDWGIKISQSERANPANVQRIRCLSERMFGPSGPLPRGPFVAQERIDAVLEMAANGVGQRAIALKLHENRESVRRWVRGLRPTNKSHKWRETEPRTGEMEFRYTQEVGRQVTALVVGPEKVPTPQFLTALTQDQLDLFIEVCILGDGCTAPNETRFVQQNSERVGAFEMACVLSGRAVHTTRKGSCSSTALLRRNVVKPGTKRDLVDYRGMIWCPRVKHGNWLARRNGSIFYTGNTYQGYGGHNKTIAQAVADGNLVLTGVWLVDDPAVETGGILTLKCRSMAKLLVDQQIYPPLVPVGNYPLAYQRFFQREVKTPLVVYGSQAPTPIIISGIEGNGTGNGYWLVGNDGGVYTFGLLQFFGSPDGIVAATTKANTPVPAAGFGVIGMSRTTTGNGYWLATEKGALYAYGDAKAQPNLTALPAGHVIVAIEGCHGTHNGFWLCSDHGEVFTFGDAPFYGGSPALPGTSIVAMTPVPAGTGYWMVDQNGNVFTFGSAAYYGGAAATGVTDICGITATPSGNGYYLVGRDGGVFTYGDAVFYGAVTTSLAAATITDANFVQGSTVVTSTFNDFLPSDVGAPLSGAFYVPLGATVARYVSATQIIMSHPATLTSTTAQSLTISRHITLADPITDLLVVPDNSGYWLAGEDGGIFTFGAHPTTASTPDSSGNGHTLTVTGPTNPQIGASSFTGFANELYFLGVDNAGNPPSQGMTAGSTGMGVTGHFSLECRFQLFSQPGGWTPPGIAGTPIYRSSIVGKYSNSTAVGGAGPQIYVEAPTPIAPLFNVVSVLHASCRNLSGSYVTLTGTTPLALDVNYVACLDFDGTTLRLFLNGALEASIAFSGPEAQDTVTPFTIARNCDSTNVAGFPFNGSIDEVRLSNTGRHAGAYTPASVPFVTDGNTVALYHLDVLNGASTTATTNAIQFLGSLPAATDNLYPIDGNYLDFTDVIADLCLWSGFWLNDGGNTANVYGVLETTGTYSTNLLDATLFDKSPVINGINQIRNIIGYLFYVDDNGAVHWHEPNYYSAGNFLPNYTHTTFIPSIDERTQITDYQLSKPDQDLRSSIVVSTTDPYNNASGTVTAEYPQQGTSPLPYPFNELKGMVKPAMWVNQLFIVPNELVTMAQLIAQQTGFKSRIGQLTCMANPMIQVNDQVIIYERETFEQNIHYVREMHSTHDLEKGSYTMVLTTNFLSPQGGFTVTAPSRFTPDGTPFSGKVVNYLTTSPATGGSQ